MAMNRMVMAIAVGMAVGFVAVAGWAQKDGAKSGETSVAERILRVEKGIEPIHAGKGDAKALDVDALMKVMNDPALSLAVIDGYKVVWAKAYGTTEWGGATPVTTKTLFQAGSISKPVAATGMLALVQA